MAYRDPYRDPYATQYAQQSGQQQYDKELPQFNPYVGYQTYDQGGNRSYNDVQYTDEPAPHNPRYDALGASQPTLVASNDVVADPQPATEPVGDYDFGAPGRPKQEKTAQALTRYRYDVQGDLWRKGGRGRCLGRFCCCSLLVTLFLIVSILLTMALWVRPPNINIGGVAPLPSEPITANSTGLTVSLGVTISVANPNFFSVAFKDIVADIIYPINNTNIGSGNEGNIVFPSHTTTTFDFPFTIDYQRALDPDNLILVDLATKCGILGNPSDISVNYKITLGLRIFFITISPVIANSFSFACPVSKQDLDGLLQAAGIDLPSGS